MLAQSAMDKATEARHAVDMHEAVCAQRYKGIIDGVAELRTIMKGAVMLIMSVLAIVLWSYLKASLKI